MFGLRSGFGWMAFALGLFCFIYFYESKKTTTAEEIRNVGKIFDFNWDSVTRVDLSNANETIEVHKKGDVWRITKPVEAIADTEAVTKILHELSYARARRVIDYKQIPEPRDKTIQQWNLHPPESRIVLRAQSGKIYELLLGRTLPTETSVYARTSNQPGVPVLLVDTELKKDVEKNLSDLRSRKVFSYDITKVRRVLLKEYATAAAVLARETEVVYGQNQKWSLQKPVVARANKDRLAEWCRNLLKLHIIDFVSDESGNFASYGLNTPQAQLTVATGDAPNDEETLLIGGVVPGKPAEVYAKMASSSATFTLPQDAVFQSMGMLPECRDRYLLDIDARLVAGITLEKAGQKIEALREGNSWRLENDFKVVLDGNKIVKFMNQLCATPILNFVKDSATDLKAYGLDKTMTKITLKQPGLTPPEIQILVGKQEKGQLLVKTSLEPSVYGVPTNFADLWPKNPGEWRSMRVMNFRPEDVVSFEIGDRTGTAVLNRNEKGVFEIRPAVKGIDAIKLNAVLQGLSQLEASRFVGAAQPAYNLNSPQLRLTVTTKSGKFALFIGAATQSGGRYAQLDGSKDCFEISAADYAEISQDVFLALAPVRP